MRRMSVWYFMLWKRLLKKPGFLVTLLVIPLLMLMLSLGSEGDTGFLNIAVAFDTEADAVGRDMVSQLDADSEIMKFTVCQDADSALSMLESSEVDAVWVFPGRLSEVIAQGVAEDELTLARVYQREENVFLKLSREKIFCTLFPDISYELYRDYIVTELLFGTDISDEELSGAYARYDSDEKIVDIVGPEGIPQADTDHLTTPMRGLLAIIMLLCGMASTMYFLADEAEGRFCLLRSTGRFWVLCAGNLCALSTAAVFVTPALILSGNYTSFLPETLAMIMLVLTSTLFCSLLGAALPSLRFFGVLLPVVLAVSVAFCPIFINSIKAGPVQMLLPPYHYMYAVGDMTRLWDMLIYTVIALPLAYIIYMITRKQTA